MECVLQWLDDLDDFVTALPMRLERLRHVALRLLGLLLSLAILGVVVALAIAVPALGPLLSAALLLSLVWQQEVPPGARSCRSPEPAARPARSPGVALQPLK